MQCFLFYLSFLLLFTACRNHDQEQKRDVIVNNRANAPVEAVPTHHNDTVTITEKTALFYWPDSARLDSLFIANGESDMRAGADDYLFYLNESAEFLKPYLPIKETDSRKYLKFVVADNKVIFIKLDTLRESWGVLFFHPSKAPKQVDITAIEEEYKKYYK